MNYFKIRNEIKTEEFSYLSLVSCLKDYKEPRFKINQLIKKGFIIRVKKGLYVFGKDYRKKAYSKELLANLIYGPSYVSLDYALAYYGAIPEKVETITSVSNKKNKYFETPIGSFIYRVISNSNYYKGVSIRKIDDSRTFLIASPEKAIVDKIYLDSKIYNFTGLKDYILDDLRISSFFLKKLNIKKVLNILKTYPKRFELFYELLKEIKK
jgi:hypothetical protein